jgi:isopenicillin N synthase-like dioxygenase
VQIAINEYPSGNWNLPETIELQKERLDRAIKSASEAAQLILTTELCAAVGITIPELSAELTRESDTCFKLVYKPAVHNAGGVVIPWHTDFGILTFLWYDDAATQIPIYDKDGVQTEEFENFGVKDGHILVYVSDDLATKSGGLLHTATHRVVAPPGEKRLKNGMGWST